MNRLSYDWQIAFDICYGFITIMLHIPLPADLLAFHVSETAQKTTSNHIRAELTTGLIKLIKEIK